MKHIPTILFMLIMLFIWSCEDMGEPILEGCMDSSACNHDPDATVDDDSCTYPQENYDCDGTCIATNQSDCCEEDGVTPDCNGTCGGSASEDCAGTCNGNSTNDACGVCEGDGSTCNISYSTVIQPIFNSRCTPCHISGNSGGLNLSSWGNLNSSDVIVPSQSNNSLLISKLESGAMPFNEPCCLESSLIQLIATWIDEGAQEN